MGQITIEAIEYECERCHYKWISRKEKPKPKRCSKCKTTGWDVLRMSYREKTLRKRIIQALLWLDDGYRRPDYFGGTYHNHSKLLNIFLYHCNPRPTEEELQFVYQLYTDESYCQYGPFKTKGSREEMLKNMRNAMTDVIKKRGGDHIKIIQWLEERKKIVDDNEQCRGCKTDIFLDCYTQEWYEDIGISESIRRMDKGESPDKKHDCDFLRNLTS